MTILYSKQGCAPCSLIKRLFENKGIEYVEKSQEELFEEHQLITVPVAVWDGELLPDMISIRNKLTSVV